MRLTETLRARLGDFAKDTRLNLQGVLEGPSSLTSAQRWGVAVASAAVSRRRELLDALVADARSVVGGEVIDDAFAAASLMAMNNVFYRFRHLVDNPAYAEKPARLRMNRLAAPKTAKVDFELFSLAASAIGACEVCIQAHERKLRESGVSEDQVLESIRIASVIHAAAIALELGDPATLDSQPERN